MTNNALSKFLRAEQTARGTVRNIVHFRLIPVLLGCTLVLGASLQPKEARADLFGNVKRSVSNTVDRARETTRSTADKARERTRDTADSARNQVRQTYQEKQRQAEHAAKERANQLQRAAQEQAQRARETAERQRQQIQHYAVEQHRKARESATALTEGAVQSATQSQRKARKYGIDLSDSIRDVTYRYGVVAGSRLEKAYQDVDDTFLETLRTVRLHVGLAGQQLVEQTMVTHGPHIGLCLARALSLADNSQEALRIAERARVLIGGFQEHIHDPQVREQAIAATITMAALGTYSYLHRNDLFRAVAYQTLSHGFENIPIKVDGRSRYLGEWYTVQITTRAPFLADTTLAKDPAALLVFGGKVMKDDLFNHVAIVPDGVGGTHTIADTINSSSNAKNVISALQLSTSIEGMALSAAENGHLGRHGETFVTVYSKADRTVQRYQTYSE